MLIKIVATLVGLYLLALVAGYLLQHRLLYPIDGQYVAPAAVGLAGIEEMRIAAPDGAQVLAWYAAAKPGAPTLLYFHGNGGSLAARTPRIERFRGEGWGVLMMTYRGYGGSTGVPSEADNIADAIRAYDTLRARGVPADDIVLYGESLGTGIATRVAVARPAAGLILDAPYTSIPDVGATAFWFMPVHAMMRDRYETKRIIDQVRVPILIVHGVLDRTIPVAMGRRLAALATVPVTLVEIPRGGHSDLYINGNDALSAVRAFINGLRR